jgi:hypothetical protein
MRASRTISLVGMVFIAMITLQGCAGGSGRGYVARDLAAPAFGRTALVVRRQNDSGDWGTKTSQARVTAAISDVLQQVPGTTLVSLPPSLHTTYLSDYELVMAARQLHTRTVCVVTVDSMGSQIDLGIGIPPYWAGSFVNYNIRLLDVATGKLLVDTRRHDDTFNPLCEPPDHALVDMQRGFRGVLAGIAKNRGQDRIDALRAAL